MAKDRSLVRASDIGAWVYCHRAWWLANVVGAEHNDPALLARGTVIHETHGHQVLQAIRLRRIGLALLAVGLVLASGLLLFFLVLR